jgi:hypothetical protein
MLREGYSSVGSFEFDREVTTSLVLSQNLTRPDTLLASLKTEEPFSHTSFCSREVGTRESPRNIG